MQNTQTAFLLFLALFFTQTIIAQDFMMQGWYWDYPKPDTTGMPPASAVDTWAKTLETQAADLGDAGFTYMWLPPASRASFGINSNGYDPQDLYDFGDGIVPTGFGYRADVDAAINAFNTAGVDVVADVVYNHRDGGQAEQNPAAENYIENLMQSGWTPFPSDRFRCVLPIGGTTGNTAGDYYFKLSSKTGGFGGFGYKIYMHTGKSKNNPFQGVINEDESNGGSGNGGGDCGQGFNTTQLNADFIGSIDGSGCTVDEIYLNLQASDFNASGDTLYISMTNTGGYSDHRFYGIYSVPRAQDIVGELEYWTFTDFTNMPSGQGAMTYDNFKPNNGNPTGNGGMQGDKDYPYFFYDVDQANPSTVTAYEDWSRWLWNDVGIRGYRMDAIKHFEPDFVGNLLDHLHDNSMDPGMVVGEWFSSNLGELRGWITDVKNNMDADTKAAIQPRIFDFSMREALKNACDGVGDKRDVFNASVVDVGAGITSFNSVTFVNNHDFRDAGQPVQSDPMLAYAYILTNNQIGLPCVFYPDYFGTSIPHAPVNNLKAPIDQLIEAHQLYIFGSTEIDYLNRYSTPYSANYIEGGANTSLIYQLSGNGTAQGKNVIVAINFSSTNTLKVDHTINTGFSGATISVGEEFTDILGNSAFPTAVVSGSNQIYMELPPRTYSVWVQGSVAVLPLELTGFQVIAKDDGVQLNWQTFQEFNVDYFEIERSLNREDFEIIRKLDAINKEDVEKSNYQFFDQEAPQNQAIYYRLKIVDFDGSIQYSEIEMVQIRKAKLTNILFAPNPVTDALQLNFNAASDMEGEFRVFDVNGKLIIKQRISIQENLNQVEINTATLIKGTYFCELLAKNQLIWQEKIIKN